MYSSTNSTAFRNLPNVVSCIVVSAQQQSGLYLRFSPSVLETLPIQVSKLGSAVSERYFWSFLCEALSVVCLMKGLNELTMH